MKVNSYWLQLFGSRPAACLTALAMLAFVAGCGRDDVKVYRVGKQQAEKTNAPEGWTAVPPGQMRVASFSVKSADGKQADVSVIPLPGSAGGIPANVNRWRGQVGLPPATEAEIRKTAEAIQISGQAAELYDLAGTNASNGGAVRILASIQTRDGAAWFFKMTGDGPLVAQQKPAFIAYLKTFDPAAAPGPSGGPSDLPPSHPPIESSALPPGHPDLSTMPAPGAAEISREGQPNWEAPSGWKEVAGGQFLVAKFILSGDAGAQAAVNVSNSAGDGGGLGANVNRWRKQLGLNEVAGAEGHAAKTMETSSGKVSFVELTGADARTGQPTSLVAAIAPQSGQTWFYKLMGDAKVVEAHKDEFVKFVQSVKY
jgi:hypothetical protein